MGEKHLRIKWLDISIMENRRRVMKETLKK